jgi:hypothetical protein
MPDQLLANPRNWRIHPKAQQEALAAVLDQVGWVQDIIVNQRTGHVVDGHARIALAISKQEVFRRMEGVRGVACPVLAAFDEGAVAQARTSLQVTGYVTTERLRALKHANAGRVALVRVSGAVTRRMLDGGRETLLVSVRRDRRAQGWAQVTSAEPCEFCAMLASRGVVYTATSGVFQAHDHCGCGLEPRFARG